MDRQGARAGVWTAAAAAGALLAACHPVPLGGGRNVDAPLAVSERLDCPARSGPLHRTAQAADGRSCAYAGPDGEDVQLAYLPLAGRPPAEALGEVEARLRKSVEPASAPSANATDADADADRDDHGDHDHVTLNLPGMHVDARGSQAVVHAFGHEIDADDGGARIRSGSIGARSVDASLLVAAQDRQAAYYARGPVAGPLVIATAHAHDEAHGFSGPVGQLRRLVDRNVRRAPR